MKRYAARTAVPVEKTRGEIEKLIRANESTGFIYGSAVGKAMIGFEYRGRRIKFVVEMPIVNKGKTNKSNVAKEEKRRWRSLLLLIKAKFESVNTGIVEFDREFLAHIVIEGDRTVGDTWVAQTREILSTAKLPPLLGAGGGT